MSRKLVLFSLSWSVGIVVLVHDEVHFPVSKALAVSFCRPFMDADAVAYVGSLRFLSFSGLSFILHLVAAVPCKFSRLILAYELIDSFVGYAYAILANTPAICLGDHCSSLISCFLSKGIRAFRGDRLLRGQPSNYLCPETILSGLLELVADGVDDPV